MIRVTLNGDGQSGQQQECLSQHFDGQCSAPISIARMLYQYHANGSAMISLLSNHPKSRTTMIYSYHHGWYGHRLATLIFNHTFLVSMVVLWKLTGVQAI